MVAPRRLHPMYDRYVSCWHTCSNCSTVHIQKKTSYYMQLNMLPNDNILMSVGILITSWLFTALWSMWPGNHLVPCVAELVGSCVPIHACRGLPDLQCLFNLSGLSLCLSIDHFCLVSVDDMVLFYSLVGDGRLVSYTALPCSGGSGLCTSSIEL